MRITENLDRHLQKATQEQRFSGVVSFNRVGELIFQDGYGQANRTWQIENRPDTRFRLASVGKMFTAVAILKLIEQGKLTFETPIMHWVDLGSSRIPATVTIRHLLTMTAGIADWFEESADWEEKWAELIRRQPIYLLRDNADFLPLFANDPPVGLPGKKHRYSNASYILLALAVESAAGQSYYDFVRQHVFEVAGMDDAGFPALDDVSPRTATGYTAVKDEEGQITAWRANYYGTTPTPVGDGGTTAGADDLHRFSQALRGGKLLAPELSAEMLMPQVTAFKEKVRGYYWMYSFANMFLLDDSGQIVRYGHTGEEDGVSCRLYHYPQWELDVVILGNQSSCAGRLGWEIHQLVLEAF